MVYTCYVCQRTVERDANGGIDSKASPICPRGKAWVWGPEPVHDECRTQMRTPYDDQAGYNALSVAVFRDFLAACKDVESLAEQRKHRQPIADSETRAATAKMWLRFQETEVF